MKFLGIAMVGCWSEDGKCKYLFAKMLTVMGSKCYSNQRKFEGLVEKRKGGSNGDK